MKAIFPTIPSDLNWGFGQCLCIPFWSFLVRRGHRWYKNKHRIHSYSAWNWNGSWFQIPSFPLLEPVRGSWAQQMSPFLDQIRHFHSLSTGSMRRRRCMDHPRCWCVWCTQSLNAIVSKYQNSPSLKISKLPFKRTRWLNGERSDKFESIKLFYGGSWSCLSAIVLSVFGKFFVKTRFVAASSLQAQHRIACRL